MEQFPLLDIVIGLCLNLYPIESTCFGTDRVYGYSPALENQKLEARNHDSAG